jgi:hypothetical protein
MCSTCVKVANELSMAWLEDTEKRELLLDVRKK